MNEKPVRCFRSNVSYLPSATTWVWMPMCELYEAGGEFGGSKNILAAHGEELFAEMDLPEAIDRVQHEGLKELLVRMNQ